MMRRRREVALREIKPGARLASRMTRMSGRAFIGTSGWNYAAWRKDFYGGLPAKAWPAFCSTRFSGIEINATHYRLQSVATFRRWRREGREVHVYFDNDARGRGAAQRAAPAHAART